MNERQMQTALESLLTNMIEAQRRGRDEIDMPDGMGEVGEVEDFVQAGVLTRDKGLIIRLADGGEFQVNIVKSR